jgi:hypothetical protein
VEGIGKEYGERSEGDKRTKDAEEERKRARN